MGGWEDGWAVCEGVNLLRNLHHRRKIFLFIYEVIVKQNKRKRSANHY